MLVDMLITAVHHIIKLKNFVWKIIIYYVRKRNLEKGRENMVFLMNREVCACFLKMVGGKRYPSAIEKEFDEQRMAEL